MIGALIGDIVGSAYEFNNIKTKEFPLLGANSHFTEDSVMTLAVAEIMHKGYITDSGKITSTFRKRGKTLSMQVMGDALSAGGCRKIHSHTAAMKMAPLCGYHR